MFIFSFLNNFFFFAEGKQILFTDFTEKNKESKAPVKVDEKRNSKWSKQEDALKNEEDISESGRIFFRNLPYSATEDELKEMFEKYGPLTEINVPIDPVTRIIKVNLMQFRKNLKF